MKPNTLPTSPFATLSLKPLESCSPSVTPLGDVLVINHQGFSAEVSLYGGQVLSFQQQDQQPIFWLTDTIHCGQSENGKEAAIRGGVPICWPWFGEHQQDASAKHGFARNMLWQLNIVDVNEDSVTVTMECTGASKHALYPHAFKLAQEITFSANTENAYQQTLFMVNDSDESVNYTGALHSYFQVSSPENIQIKALESAEYYDKVRDVDNNAPAPLANCIGPLDRIYYTNKVMQMVDSKWQRTLELSSSNCQQWVLWNPGQEGAAAMADIHQGGEQHFVCLEAANSQWQTIAPRASASISQNISISKK